MDPLKSSSVMEVERKLAEDIETAKALSLEAMALEKFKKERSSSLTKSNNNNGLPKTPEPVYSKIVKNSPDLRRTTTDIKPRPRPGAILLPNSEGLVPPPLPKRQNSVPADGGDLISLKSPAQPKEAATPDFDFVYRQASSSARYNQRHYSIQSLHYSSLVHSPAPREQTHNSITFPKQPTSNTPLPSHKTSQAFDLIDLSPLSMELPINRNSILCSFDPLLSVEVESSRQSSVQAAEMLYQDYDPFDYYFGLSQQQTFCSGTPSQRNERRETIYEVITKEQSPAKTKENEKTESTLLRQQKKTLNDLTEKLKIFRVQPNAGHPLTAFVEMVQSVRRTFTFDDVSSNPGFIVSSKVENSSTTSVKLEVYIPNTDLNPVVFTCDISSSVEHVVGHVLCERDMLLSQDQPVDNFILKVYGLSEYLVSGSRLQDYEYVHKCIKLEQDVKLCLINIEKVSKPFARTAVDDSSDVEVKAETLLPRESVHALSFDAIQILLETLESEMQRLITGVSSQPKSLLQSVSALCSLLGRIETVDLSRAMESISSAASGTKAEIVGEDGPYSMVVLPRRDSKWRLQSVCADLTAAVRALLTAYASTFRVDFTFPSAQRKSYDSSTVMDCVSFRLCALHRPRGAWDFDSYEVRAQLFHGTVCITHDVVTRNLPSISRPAMFFADRVVFDEWISFKSVAISTLPRESRMILVLVGRRKNPEADHNAEEEKELGWSAISFFNSLPEWRLVQGSYFLPLWPETCDRRVGHAPSPGSHPQADWCPFLSVELPDFNADIVFPEATRLPEERPRDFSSLDDSTQQLLSDIVEIGSFTKMPSYHREVLWEKRQYLVHEPSALPKILLAAHSWDWASLPQLYWLLEHWQPLRPIDAVQLLLPCFPDIHVRARAVQWLRSAKSDELVDYLPQLIEALKLEAFDNSPLARFLLERSLTNPRVAHAVFWLLVQQLPGSSPQNSDSSKEETTNAVADIRHSRRLQLMLRAILSICGVALRHKFMSEQLLVQQLDAVASRVKTTKESLRLSTLLRELEPIHFSLSDNPTSLPVSPSVQVEGLEVRSCAYFPSNTLPLKLVFKSAEPEVKGEPVVSAIYKVGDDLRQDMLTIQLIRIMDKLWLKNGLDLKMVTFSCIPTGPRRGFVELISDAETLRKIHVEHGLTGSFKDRPIADWLAKHNPSPLEYERAVRNFTASCAGYIVATYVLGICDRHNDNIMVKTTGHLFHIDFGKFLGDAQMFGNFKRDRTPFVLTSDMAYVINGGDKPSARFQYFVDLCCQAFNIVRQHSNSLLHLLALMATSGIPGVSAEAVGYVQRALLPELSNAEAAATFSRMIEDSLSSWFTQFNFFLHNLAQLRFHGDHNDGQLLSFVPKTFTVATDGKIQESRVVAFQKRYEPEKHYVYIVRVKREKQVEPVHLFRSYREFCELHQKLCLRFPLISNKIYSLSKGVHLGRSSVKVVAEKRRAELDRFLVSLFSLAYEITHSDLVYTFLHPLLRDQEEESSINMRKYKIKPTPSTSMGFGQVIQGQLKISLQYSRGELQVMIMHGRELAGVNVSGNSSASVPELPSPYVKTYLLPDPQKITKRKTRVVRKNSNPTFMEMLVYRLPVEVVSAHVLQVSVWSYDRVQENAFLGAVKIPIFELDITREHVAWYSLGNLHSMAKLM